MSIKSDWIDPKIIIGNIAIGNYYFNRENIVERIWQEIKKGQHLLLVAPRRVGKTSIMEHMAATCDEEFICLCENVQSIKSDNDLYKRLYTILLNKLNGLIKRKWFKNFIDQLNITEITATGLKFGDKKELDYAKELFKLFEKIVENDVKVVLFIDELPEVLMNLYKKKDNQTANAILDQLREWRQNVKFTKYITFVLAGSVGLPHIVKLIDGRLKDINDIHKIDFEVFDDAEAIDYINWATNGATVQYNQEQKAHVLTKVGQGLPYFINLLLDEINKKARKTGVSNIALTDIDDAFDIIVMGNDSFQEWHNRLYEYFPKADAAFMNEILTHIAHKNNINLNKLHDIAKKHKKGIDYMLLIKELVTDGYIKKTEESYFFISPFLKQFWFNINPVYNG